MRVWRTGRKAIAIAIVIASGIAQAQPATIVAPAVPIRSIAEALAEDAAVYAARYDVPFESALARLRAQADSVATTDRLAEAYRDRLAGIAIEHVPEYRIVILLTGDAPVPDETIAAGGLIVPIVFHTGAPATRAQILAAIESHQAELRGQLRTPPGLGVDPRAGALVAVVAAADADRIGETALQADFERRTGVPVRIEVRDRDNNLSVVGGSRVDGVEPADGRRYVCTSGFVVTDGARDGIITAAHCPDDLSFVEPGGTRTHMTFVGQWGARYQDVQVHAADDVLAPLFYADAAKRALRPLTSWRNRASTRAGDIVCHRGERSGSSCAEVELVDYAPPGDLCGGPCTADWVTVAGPSCSRGDSGGPVFSGTIAFGIVKGGSYRRDGGCNFYYYMSTDYLPPGWTLKYSRQPG